MNTRKVCLFCLVLLLVSTAAHAKIVFSSERNGVKGIYVMDDDGSNQTVLVEGGRPTPRSWSPDGKQILFRKGGGHLFLMDPDGTNIRLLKKEDYVNRASFSPDGKFIVYYRKEDDKQKSSVVVLNIKTGKIKQIADDGIQHDWSPDDRHILFAEATRPGRSNTIWIMGADGQNPRELIPNPGPQRDNFRVYREGPRWSPDGRQVVFIEREQKQAFVPNEGNGLIYKAFRYIICDRNGDNIRQLRIPKDWECYGIDWMDDGKSVVFTARAGMPIGKLIRGAIDFPPCYVYKYHIKTGEITQLTNDPGWDQTIDWISDDVLSVTPQDKKKVAWGAIKK